MPPAGDVMARRPQEHAELDLAACAHADPGGKAMRARPTER
jgi:hypothetical protein